MSSGESCKSMKLLLSASCYFWDGELMALCSGCAAAGDGPLNVWACVFESGDCPMNTPCAETTLCCIIPRYVNEKQSPRSKNCIWLHQISSKGSHCGYSTFYRILKKTPKNPQKTEVLKTLSLRTSRFLPPSLPLVPFS